MKTPRSLLEVTLDLRTYYHFDYTPPAARTLWPELEELSKFPPAEWPCSVVRLRALLDEAVAARLAAEARAEQLACSLQEAAARARKLRSALVECPDWPRGGLGEFADRCAVAAGEPIT